MMDSPIAIVLIVLVLLALVLFLLVPRMRHKKQERKREQAREHLQEAQLRASHAKTEEAAAQEQAARARRERAEAEERAAMQEREASERAARAAEHHAQAQGLHEKARALAPDLVETQRGGNEHGTVVSDGTRQETVTRETLVSEPVVGDHRGQSLHSPQRGTSHDDTVHLDTSRDRVGSGGDLHDGVYGDGANDGGFRPQHEAAGRPMQSDHRDRPPTR